MSTDVHFLSENRLKNFNPWAKFQTFRHITPVLLGKFQHLLLLPPPKKKEVTFSVRSVFCLSVCLSDYSQTCERIFTKFWIGKGPSDIILMGSRSSKSEIRIGGGLCLSLSASGLNY